MNQSKTKIVHYRTTATARSNVIFKCGPMTIDYATKYKYLGVWLEEHVNIGITAAEIAKSASRALGVITSKARSMGGMDYNVYERLYTNLVQPIISYGSSIIGLSEHRVFNNIHNRAGNMFLGVSSRTSNEAVRGDLGWSRMIDTQQVACARLFLRLHNTDNTRINYKVHKWSLKRRSSWDFKTQALLLNANINIGDYEYSNIPAKAAISNLKNYFEQRDPFLKNLWNDRNNEVNGNKLRTYRQFKYGVVTESYVKMRIPRHHRRLLAQLRTGSLQLHIETGRWSNLNLQDRTCKLCDSESIEDELHFLIQCSHYDDLRSSLYNIVREKCPHIDLEHGSSTLIFISLLHRKNIQKSLSATMYHMCQRRQFNLERI